MQFQAVLVDDFRFIVWIVVTTSEKTVFFHLLCCESQLLRNIIVLWKFFRILQWFRTFTNFDHSNLDPSEKAIF